jgi:hypothetical protein
MSEEQRKNKKKISEKKEKESEEEISKEESSEEKTEEDGEDNFEENQENLEEVFEEDNYEKMALSRFLSNPWKQVSLEDRNFSPVLNLEEDLPEKENTKKDLDEEKMEYQLFKGIEEGKYQNFSIEEDFKREKLLSEQEKELDKMKRLYENPKKLSREFEGGNNDSIKYVKPEDTNRTDYLLKKKFGDN